MASHAAANAGTRYKRWCTKPIVRDTILGGSFDPHRVHGFAQCAKGKDVKREELIESEVRAWAPELAESLNAMAYLETGAETQWLSDSNWSSQMELLIQGDGYATAAELWQLLLKNKAPLSAPVLLLILEYMRRKPAEMEMALRAANLGFSKTLSNVAFRAADALHEDAKSSFAGDELDVAIARFRAALADFRFAIESQELTDKTRRIATGKYATALAMIGRWVNVSPDAIARALSYSRESLALGNAQPETFAYRLELLVQQFDATGDVELIKEALVLQSQNKHAAGTEIAETEVRYRMSRLATPKPREATRYLTSAKRLLDQCVARNGTEEVRRKLLRMLVTKTINGELPISPQSGVSPKGVLAQMATEPSVDLWRTVRMMISELDELRVDRGSIPAAVLSVRFLRQMIDGPGEILTDRDMALYVEIADRLAQRSVWNRYIQWEAGAAALSAAKKTENRDLAQRAVMRFRELATKYPTWPLPFIGIARAEDFLAPEVNEVASTAADSWRKAASLALCSPLYSRCSLGGRNEVFAVSDARGFLSGTFVFKRTTHSNAQHEAMMLRLLREEVMRSKGFNRFEVPRSLAIVEVPSSNIGQWVHVSQRAVGRLLSDLAAEEALDVGVLDSVVDLLTIFHRIAGSPPEGKSAWRSLKADLKMWSRTLFDLSKADDFVESLRGTFPEGLPLVRKRDAHAANWLLDPAGRIVAVDFESTDFIPLGYDVVQLIEDYGLLEASRDGWQKRLALMGRYLDGLGQTLSQPQILSAYCWFAVTRALRLGTEREAGKRLRRHARELCGLLVECGEASIKGIARELLRGLSRIDQVEQSGFSLTHDHRRLSKAMAYQLRHQGQGNGLSIDQAGFAALEDLARILNVDASALLKVAEHPGEPRYEVRSDRIRALYGHSFEVVVDASVDVGSPNHLYHGSSWSALNEVVRNGLAPMQRQKVHLTNSMHEAMAVGARKGAPLIFSVEQNLSEKPVADGIWVAASVPPQRLSIINPFVGETGALR